MTHTNQKRNDSLTLSFYQTFFTLAQLKVIASRNKISLGEASSKLEIAHKLQSHKSHFFINVTISLV